MTTPKTYSGIMVSSTFSDLEQHRREVIKAIGKLDFHPKVMETSGARADTDLIDTSLNMVRDSTAFIGVISHRYGLTPKCPKRNPDNLSISELEFNEAMRLGRPILLFIMDDEHPGTKADFEQDPAKQDKLDAFRERAKQMHDGSEVERIYEVFDSLQEFATKVATAMGPLSQSLSLNKDIVGAPDEPASPTDSIETALPPDLRAVPRYLGSHDFVGRAAELDTLNDWCAEADPHPMLLFEAIGGSGKSMVTWTWLTQHATAARDDWAGRFWFSFYEGGATMTSFCQQALAYMTSEPIKTLRKKKIRQLMPQLIAALEARPWLIVLDGLERILVAYHRIDAPQMRDEDVETAEDQISDRDPRATINPEDEDLLRLLTAAAPSKILVTSRLTPQALINRSDMPMPGVRREMLGGLRPADAEALFRSCGVSGESKAIQDYMQRNCNCHPLVIGALAGLVNTYLPDRGNFDAWLVDPEAGGELGLADLDLTQRRNHILDAAIDVLPESGRKLLQTLSLLQGGADYTTLKEFNPHLPSPPKEVKEPISPEKWIHWHRMDDQEKETAKNWFDKVKKSRAAYIEALKAWEQSPKVLAAPTQFDETLTELERRGLLQYEHGLKRYDLHPVVRGVAAGRMGEADTSTIGSRVVDHFSNRQHDPFEQAESLEDLAPGIQLVATLIRMGQFDRALDTLWGELHIALQYNLMAFGEIQRLVRPIFLKSWDGPLAVSGELNKSFLFNVAANCLIASDLASAQNLYIRMIRHAISNNNINSISVGLNNLFEAFELQGKQCRAVQILALDLAKASRSTERIFRTLLYTYKSERNRGAFDPADTLWAELDLMGRDWSRSTYQGGEAEMLRACDLFWRGLLTDAALADAEGLCREGRNRDGICSCLSLRGEWHLSRDEPDLAIEPLNEVLRLYREANQENAGAEALLTLAQLRAGHSVDVQAVAKRLDSMSRHETALPVAELWRELDESERAIAAALRAHKSACGSGEPYVYRYYLDRAEALLRDLGETPPDVPQHDPANDEVFDWEDDVRALIEKTRKEREEQERKEAESKKKKPDA